jgi:TatD DNase family protein
LNYLDFHTHQSGCKSGVFSLEPNFEIPASGYFSAGFHPWFLEENWAQKIDQLQKLSLHPRCVAIGESGFDRLKGPALEVQETAFRAQTELAVERGLPMILHVVKSHDLLLRWIKNTPNRPPIIWHGFNLKVEIAKEFEKFGIFYSFGKALLNPESNASNWIKSCAPEQIFLETDDSGLNIMKIYEAASLLLHCEVEELANQVKVNWNRISTQELK